MKTMDSLLYISSDLSDVQEMLSEALEREGVRCNLYYYSISSKSSAVSRSENVSYYLSNSKLRGPVFYIARLKRAAYRIMKTFDCEKVSLIHGNMSFADGYICRLISKNKKIPYVVSFRNMDMNLWFFWKLPWMKRMGINNLKEARAIIFLSKSYMNELLYRLSAKDKYAIKNKCVVIPNGINNYWINNIYGEKRTKPEKQIRFITCGRIEENKNQVLTAKAIERFKIESGLDVHYTVIGKICNEVMKAELLKFDFVEIKQHMQKEELLLEIRNNDIYIMTSHKESFGLVYAEAMSQGLPVIYSRGQGFDGQFEDGIVGFSVESHDENDICKGIKKTIEWYEYLSKNAKQLCTNFSWDNITERLKETYDSVL